MPSMQEEEHLRFKCASCGEWHEGLPSLGFLAPDHIGAVPQDEINLRVSLDEDFCTIDETYFFARCVLQLPILGRKEGLSLGVWSSLSPENFDRYAARYGTDRQADLGPMFGWFSNQLPGYPNTLGLKLHVWPQDDGFRPLIELEPTDHPLAIDQREGISAGRLRKLLPVLWAH